MARMSQGVGLADREKLKTLIHSIGLSKTDTLLLLLSVEGGAPKQVKDIKALGTELGVKGVKSWNVSPLLASANPKAIRTNSGWELGPLGIERVYELGVDLRTQGVERVAADLRAISKGVADANIRSFVDEAINSLENRSYRAATVVAWIGAMAVLYEYVLANELSAFNSEARRRTSKWKDAVNFDDLADMKEDTFLDVLHAISIIGKSVKDELKSRLKMRNGAGHPNTFSVGENMVRAHIESLINNVYQKF